MSNINQYLPKVLQSVKELQLVNKDLDIELDLLKGYVKGVYSETIVSSATEYGVKKWEKTLNIVPKEGDSLATRKFVIQNILTNKLPYTVRWLMNKLTEITGSSSAWTLNIEYESYTVTIVLAGLNTDWMMEVQKVLRIALPANMELLIGGEPLTGNTIRYSIATHLGYKLKFNS